MNISFTSAVFESFQIVAIIPGTIYRILNRCVSRCFLPSGHGGQSGLRQRRGPDPTKTQPERCPWTDSTHDVRHDCRF